MSFKNISRINFIIIVFLMNLLPLYAANYYVSKTGNDSWSGTKTQPWGTIQKAADTMVAGDTCYVSGGTYDERVSPQNSGSEGSFITYKAVGQVVMHGFDITKDYIRIIGFEITETADDWRDGPGIFIMYGDHCEIWNNYIHHTMNWGIRLHLSNSPFYTLIKGNHIENVYGIGIEVAGHYNLIEYNEIHHALGGGADADGFRFFSKYNIFRNNYIHDITEELAPGAHADCCQTFPNGSSGYGIYVQDILIEKNYCYNFGQFFMANGDGNQHHIMFRNNVYKKANNTWQGFCIHDNSYITIVQNVISYCNSLGVKLYNSNYDIIKNNIFYDVPNPYTTSATGLISDYNLSYAGGSLSETNGINGQNPKFTDYTNGDMHLQNGSPCINSGGPLAVTTGSGSGTQINVDEARYFIDGFGIVKGDLITIGSNNPIRITNIDYDNDIITVENSISWNNGDWINYAYNDSGPDIGPYEYSSNNQFGISFANISNGSQVSGAVGVEANITNEDIVRHVVFYVDGIPQRTDSEAPYGFVWNTADLEEGSYSLKVTAYGLQTGNDTETDEVVVVVGQGSSDITSPVISDINVTDVTDTGARITWTTDEWAIGEVEYGSTIAYGNTEKESDFTTTHSITLTGLTPGKQYHYRIKSSDVFSNEKVTVDYTFTTAVQGTIQPPAKIGEINIKAYPNPCIVTETNSMRFQLSGAIGGELRIYTISGKFVRKLTVQSGSEAVWDIKNVEGSNVQSGIYVYVLTDVDRNRSMGKLVLAN